MRSFLLSLTTGLLVLSGMLTAEEGLQSARNALAEYLPDIAALRIERFLESHSDLTAEAEGEALLLLAECYLRAGKPAQAQKVLNDIPEKLSSDRDYWLGVALSHQHEYLSALEKFAQVDPESSLYQQALFNTIELQVSLEKTSQAFANLEKIRAHDPSFLSAEVALLEAQLSLETGDRDKALQAWETLSPKNQKTSSGQLLAGRIALARQDPDAALGYFDTVLAQDTPEGTQTLALLGKSDTLLSKGRAKQAIPPLLELLKQEKDSALLDLLHGRFKTLLTRGGKTDELAASLTDYAKPATLGEDSNYTTPGKLFACYYLARISPLGETAKYLNPVFTFAPEGELAARAHLLQAELAFQEGDQEAVKAALEAAQKTAPASALASRAADALARLAVREGDLQTAENLFAKAAEHPSAAFTEQALLNQAILQLRSQPDAPLSALSAKLTNQEAQDLLELEQALAWARESAPPAKEALREFVLQHPTHPRLAQARLALANVLLSESKPDYELVEQQLSSLPDDLDRSLSRENFRVNHRLAAITNDWSRAVSEGERHLKAFPEAQDDPYFLLPLAESSFQNGDYNRSRFLFAKVATLPEVGELAELSLLYAARSNLLIPTREATVEAFDILDGIIAQAGPLTTRARFLKARNLLKSQGQASECLKILDGIPGKPGDQPEAALLAAEAHRELVSENPQHAELAISIYQRLLDDPRTSYEFSNQIHYQLALTYRENGQLNLAIEPCLRVVDFENKPKDEKKVEWDYYYRCGFEAIDILLEAKRARAALILARKLAQTGGPGAEQARERAEQILLDHLLWSD